jgi:hypothetical protein
MKKKYLQLLLAFAAILNFSSKKLFSQEKFQHEKLITIWETKKDLKTPESVLYDNSDDVLYVSNINNKPWEKDNNGFISKMNLKGDIIEAQWVKGLSAPKGMGISKGKLYVADINQIAEIDIKKGEIINKYTIDTAKKLNDITVDKSGTVYVSDKGAATIYSLKKGKVELFLKNVELKEINGLYAQGNILYAGLENKVVNIDLITKSITTFVDNTGPIDGLVPTGKGTFLVSDWTGCIYEIKQGQKPVLLLNTTPLQIYAADIEYVTKENILLVPTFFKDNVVAYKKSE